MQDRHRLKKSADFKRVYAARRRRDSRLLTVYSRPNELPHSRVGFSVSTKVGGASIRNLVKRRLRAACRAWLEEAGRDPVDVVVVARPEAASAPFEVLSGELRRLLGGVLTAASADLDGPRRRTRT